MNNDVGEERRTGERERQANYQKPTMHTRAHSRDPPPSPTRQKWIPKDCKLCKTTS